jgi:ABC-type multidrug transport system fused ATPase/permease subunit
MYSKSGLVSDFVKNNRFLVAEALFLGITNILLGVLIPIFLGKFYQLALHTHSPRGKVFDSLFYGINDLHTYFMVFASLIAMKFALNFGQKYLVGIISETFIRDLRVKLFSKHLITRLDVLHRKETGKYLLRYTGDLSAVQNYLNKGMIAFLNDCILILTTLAVFTFIEPRLTVIIMVSFPLMFLIVFAINQNLKKITRKRRNIRSNNLSFVASRLGALLTIKVFNRETIESDKFQKKTETLYDAGISYYRLYALINSLLPLMLYTMLGLILYVASELNRSGHARIHGSQILIFIMLTINALPVLRRILQVNTVWQTGDISFEKILKILNAEEENRDKTGYAPIVAGELDLKNVDFQFEENNPIFRQLNIKAGPKGIYLISGPQGIGKSILFKLLLGLYDPNAGVVMVDTNEIKKISKYGLRKSITMVSDELPLIGNTIFEAISYSRKEEKRSEAEQMLSRIGFPNKEGLQVLDTPVVEGGRNFSSGERKLLMIARALLTKKKILLMDEPFRDLDGLYVDQVSYILDSMRKDKTILITDKEGIGKLTYDDKQAERYT